MPFKLTKNPKSPYWQITGSEFGVRLRESTGTSRKGEAEAILQARRSQLLAAKTGETLGEATFSEAAEGYLMKAPETEAYYMRKIIPVLGDMSLKEIWQKPVDAAAQRAYPNAQPSTVKRQFYTPVVAVMRYAAKNRMCHPVLIEKPKVVDKEIIWLTPSEAEAWIGAARPRLSAYVTFLLGTGLRASEAISLRWSSISPDMEYATVWDEFAKAKKARTIWLQPRVREVLGSRQTGYVFPEWSSPSIINTALRREAKRSNLKRFTNHVLRHTWATWTFAMSKDVTYLMKYGGWASEKLAHRYIHTGTPDLKKHVENQGWTYFGAEND
jgi:integrase